MTTTTPAAIMAKIAQVLEALTPASAPANNESFAENKAPHPQLNRWTLATAEERVFRLFEVAPMPGAARVDLGVQHPEATLCNETFLVVVAYPARPSLIGYTQLRDLWNLMSADAQQIRNALALLTGLVGSGHSANFVEVRGVDRSRDNIWFQEISVRAQFYVAQ